MELTTKAISELCKDYYFNIPAYQREYRWDNQLSLPVLNFLRKSLAGIDKVEIFYWKRYDSPPQQTEKSY